MIKTHEVALYGSQFTKFIANGYLIIQNNNYDIEDYILIKQVETVDGETAETGLHSMTRIKEVITNEGLKDGYVMLTLVKL